MAHFPFHIGGAPLVHGSTAGISQAGQRGRRVYIDPARGRAHITEIRAALPAPGSQSGQFANGTTAVDSRASVFHGELDIPFLDRLPCLPFMTRDPFSGECVFKFGEQQGPDMENGSFPDRDANGVDHSGGAGAAVRGGFNMPAFVPGVVGNITRRDGTTGPILRCPRGTVLATDNLCYAKGIRGLAAHRKWKPGPRPFLPPKDIQCLRRAVAIRKNKDNRRMFRELGLG